MKQLKIKHICALFFVCSEKKMTACARNNNHLGKGKVNYNDTSTVRFEAIYLLVLNGVYSRIIKCATFFENRRHSIIVFKKEIIV